MGNTTTNLVMPAAQPLGTELIYVEQVVDFAVEGLAIAGTMDVLRLPKGAVPLRAGVITLTVDTQTTATLALDTSVSALVLSAAAVLGDANSVRIANLAASQALPADDTVRILAAEEAFSDGKVVIWAEYAVSDSCRN
jgi:hypothetical protein